MYSFTLERKMSILDHIKRFSTIYISHITCFDTWYLCARVCQLGPDARALSCLGLGPVGEDLRRHGYQNPVC